MWTKKIKPNARRNGRCSRWEKSAWLDYQDRHTHSCPQTAPACTRARCCAPRALRDAGVGSLGEPSLSLHGESSRLPGFLQICFLLSFKGPQGLKRQEAAATPSVSGGPKAWSESALSPFSQGSGTLISLSLSTAQPWGRLFPSTWSPPLRPAACLCSASLFLGLLFLPLAGTLTRPGFQLLALSNSVLSLTN